MSHDTHSGHSTEIKSIISFKNSFWLIIILVGLFVAALNFIQAENRGEEGEAHEGARTEAGIRTEHTPAMHEAKDHGNSEPGAKQQEGPRSTDTTKGQQP